MHKAPGQEGSRLLISKAIPGNGHLHLFGDDVVDVQKQGENNAKEEKMEKIKNFFAKFKITNK